MHPKGDDALRVLQICDTLDTSNGGPARNAFELNKALNAMADVAVDLVWVRGQQQDSVLEDSALPDATIAYPGPRKLVAIGGCLAERTIGLVDVAKAMRASDAVIVHGFYLPWIPVALLVATTLGKDVFVMPHGALTAYETTRGARKKAAFRKMIGLLFLRCIRAVAVGSDDEATDVSKLLPDTPAVTCGVGTSTLEAPLLRAPSVPLRLLTLGRLAKKKRIDVSILALKELLRSGVDAHLTIAGTGPERASLERLALSAGVARRVEFVGQVSGDTKRKLYHNSDIFILASEDENFGIVVAEALAHGLPTVASRHVQAAAVAADSTAVSLIEAPIPGLVARAVTGFLIADYASLQKSAAAVAREQFSWTSVSHRWIEMMQRYSRSKDA